MSKGNTFENELLLHIFNNSTIPLIGDASGLLASATAGSLYVSLHTSNPDETGVQTTSECDYGSYDRVAVARSGAGWTVASNAVTNAALIQFPQCSSGTNTVTHFAVGTAAYAGAGKILYKGQLTSPLSVSSGIQPQFAAGDLDITED